MKNSDKDKLKIAAQERELERERARLLNPQLVKDIRYSARTIGAVWLLMIAWVLAILWMVFIHDPAP